MNIHIGIKSEDRTNIADSLSKVLANTYTLYLKTQNFHWNVTGPNFQSLHTLFEAEYTELAIAADTIAERIRALGAVAPGSFSRFLELTSLKEAPAKPLNASDMLKQLIADHETVDHSLRATLALAHKAGDEGTLSLMAGRIEVHEKAAWMLRSSL